MAYTFHFKDIDWFSINQVLLPLVPPHQNIYLTQEEVQWLLKNTDNKIVRVTTDYDTSLTTSWWYIVRDKMVNIDEFTSDIKSKVRRGLKQTNLEYSSKIELKNCGYPVYISAFLRYKTYEKPLTEQKYYEWLDSLPPTSEFWILYLENKAVGFSINQLWEDCCFYRYVFLDPYYFNKYITYSLFYRMNEYYLNQKKLRYVTDGARSILHSTSIHELLVEQLHFRKAYCKLHLYYTKPINSAIRFLYPFKTLFQKADKINFVHKINALMMMEEAHRDSV